jgi:hypothetical protein
MLQGENKSRNTKVNSAVITLCAYTYEYILILIQITIYTKQLICNHQVAGLSPIIGFNKYNKLGEFYDSPFSFTHTFAENFCLICLKVQLFNA